MGNKQKLETHKDLQSYDLTGIKETWRDSSHAWNAAMDRYGL